jgi:UDPglucose 6-dehydrogenase
MLYKIISAITIPENKNKFTIASNPEFLAEGTAINDLLNPDRIVIGVKDNDIDISNLTKLYNFASEKIIFTNNASSELSKLVSNCFLAQRVSSINSIAILCESYDADIL